MNKKKDHLLMWPFAPLQTVSPEMLQLLSALRHKVAIGFVGGSDLAKQQEQLGTASIPVTTLFDFCFAENGLTAIRMGVPLASHSFIKWIGEDNYKQLVKFILHYVADLDIPVKRGTFVEFRNGMINVSPIGRNATIQERNEYEKFDLEHKIREKFVQAIKEKFPDLGLTYVLEAPPERRLSTSSSTTKSLLPLTIHFSQLLHRRPDLL
jgi:phosphomannomutase